MHLDDPRGVGLDPADAHGHDARPSRWYRRRAGRARACDTARPRPSAVARAAGSRRRRSASRSERAVSAPPDVRALAAAYGIGIEIADLGDWGTARLIAEYD